MSLACIYLLALPMPRPPRIELACRRLKEDPRHTNPAMRRRIANIEAALGQREQELAGR